jgi:hypothetical protein
VTALATILGLMAFGIWAVLVAGANLNAYPSEVHEPNDYGEKK